MPLKRTGQAKGFWDNASAGSNSTSTEVKLPYNIGKLAVWITSSGSTTISVECCHSGDPVGGIQPDTNANDWGLLYYLNTAMQVTFTSSGTVCMIIPDFEPGWIRLRTSSAVTLTAGWEAMP